MPLDGSEQAEQPLAMTQGVLLADWAPDTGSGALRSSAVVSEAQIRFPTRASSANAGIQFEYRDIAAIEVELSPGSYNSVNYVRYPYI